MQHPSTAHILLVCRCLTPAPERAEAIGLSGRDWAQDEMQADPTELRRRRGRHGSGCSPSLARILPSPLGRGRLIFPSADSAPSLPRDRFVLRTTQRPLPRGSSARRRLTATVRLVRTPRPLPEASRNRAHSSGVTVCGRMPPHPLKVAFPERHGTGHRSGDTVPNQPLWTPLASQTALIGVCPQYVHRRRRRQLRMNGPVIKGRV